MTLSGIIGALAGTFLAGIMPGEWLRKIFGVMLVSGGIMALRSTMSGTKKGKSEEYSKNLSTKEADIGKNTTARGEKNSK